MHQQLQQGGLIAEAGLALPLDVSPVQGSDGAHFLALDATQIRDGRPWFVFDLRRIVHPPLVTFWAAVQPQPVTLPGLLDLLATVVGAPRDELRTGRPPEPAVFRTSECLLHRPGFQSSVLREERARRRICTSTTTTWVHSSQVSSPVYTQEAGVGEPGVYVLSSSATTTGTPPASSSFPPVPRPSTALLQDVTSLAGKMLRGPFLRGDGK